MSRRRSGAWFAFALLAPLLVAGCRSVPLIEPPPLGGTGDKRTQRAAILRGLLRHGWEPREVSPGRIDARLVRRQHWAEVAIHYTALSAAIRYRDSEALLCRQSGRSCSTIHRAYNRWVVQLRKDIALEIAFARADAR